MIKNTHKKANRKITDYSDGFVKTRPAEETKADWEYSVWSGAGAQPAPSAKRKRGAPKKERSDVKQSKLEQMTLVCYLFLMRTLNFIKMLMSFKNFRIAEKTSLRV